MPRRDEIVYCDVETTGLIVGYHEPFELVFKCGDAYLDFWLDVDLSKASPEALRKNRYYERVEAGKKRAYEQDKRYAAWKIAEFTSGRTLAGDNPRYDADMVEALLVSQGLQPAWRHNLLDVPVYAAGALGLKAWTYRELMESLGVEQKDEDQHTALGDVLRCESIHKAAIRLHEERKTKVARVLERMFLEAAPSHDLRSSAEKWADVVEAEILPRAKEKR